MWLMKAIEHHMMVVLESAPMEAEVITSLFMEAQEEPAPQTLCPKEVEHLKQSIPLETHNITDAGRTNTTIKH